MRCPKCLKTFKSRSSKTHIEKYGQCSICQGWPGVKVSSRYANT
jgi:hypothetical protein